METTGKLTGYRTDAKLRFEIQHSKGSLKVLARRFGLNPKTIAKWKRRSDVDSLPPGPRPGGSSRLTAEEEELIVAFRETTLLPLDDCLYALQARIPDLSRSTLHRCLRRHGISRLPDAHRSEKTKADRRSTLPGCFHIDRAEVPTADGPFHIFFAIEEASKLVFVQLAENDGSAASVAFLEALDMSAPMRVTKVFTPSESPFATDSTFACLCREHSIEREEVTGRQSWGRRRAQILGEFVLQRRPYEGREHLLDYLQQFVGIYNFRRRLKVLRGKTPHEAACRLWEADPGYFVRNPHHVILKPEFMAV